MFIVFEGGDGCGKSTQLDLCAKWLHESGRECVRCNDPGTTELGSRVRSLLLEHGSVEIDLRAEMLLFMVARAQLIQEVVKPALAENKIVLCDRFVLSTVVYQGHAGVAGRQLNRETIYQIGEIATDAVSPDLYLTFDLPVEKAAERVGPKKDRMESRGSEFFENVRRGFIAESEALPDLIKLIDADQSIEKIHEQVKSLISPLLG